MIVRIWYFACFVDLCSLPGYGNGYSQPVPSSADWPCFFLSNYWSHFLNFVSKNAPTTRMFPRKTHWWRTVNRQDEQRRITPETRPTEFQCFFPFSDSRDIGWHFHHSTSRGKGHPTDLLIPFPTVTAVRYLTCGRAASFSAPRWCCCLSINNFFFFFCLYHCVSPCTAVTKGTRVPFGSALHMLS